MTWRELAEKIKALTPEQQEMEVLLYDTYEQGYSSPRSLQVEDNKGPSLHFFPFPY